MERKILQLLTIFCRYFRNFKDIVQNLNFVQKVFTSDTNIPDILHEI